jgi:hypothetical protein
MLSFGLINSAYDEKTDIDSANEGKWLSTFEEQFDALIKLLEAPQDCDISERFIFPTTIH